MTIHYHGTPITPRTALNEMAGRCFCVSFARDENLKYVHEIGQSVMLDNGAYSIWQKVSGAVPYPWDEFYAWAEPWLEFKTTWAVIPDVIGGTEDENEKLICDSIGRYGRTAQLAPVWHMHESLTRLGRLADTFERICIGSSGEYAMVGTERWNGRMNEAFNHIAPSGRVPCWIHMLRGMSLTGSIYPFASVDSTDVARHHNRPQNTPGEMARVWDSRQNPARWKVQATQGVLQP